MAFDRGWQKKGCLDVFLTVFAVAALAVFTVALVVFVDTLTEVVP